MRLASSQEVRGFAQSDRVHDRDACEAAARTRDACEAFTAQSEMADWVPFHQQEALTTRLANILEEYPVGVGSLREFVQNADDAGASTLVFAVDTRAHASPADASPVATSRTAPSLLVWNDASFSERDFESIISIGRSRKREDGTTIGKYGLGFNVAYHFTDCVQFVSGRSLECFDPHGTAISDGNLGCAPISPVSSAPRSPV